LDELLAPLDEQRQVVPGDFQRLAYLTDYAVLLRYTISEQLDEALNRPALVRDVSGLIEHVERILQA